MQKILQNAGKVTSKFYFFTGNVQHGELLGVPAEKYGQDLSSRILFGLIGELQHGKCIKSGTGLQV
jgi:hypothetical protein